MFCDIYLHGFPNFWFFWFYLDCILYIKYYLYHCFMHAPTEPWVILMMEITEGFWLGSWYFCHGLQYRKTNLACLGNKHCIHFVSLLACYASHIDFYFYFFFNYEGHCYQVCSHSSDKMAVLNILLRHYRCTKNQHKILYVKHVSLRPCQVLDLYKTF